MVNIKTRLMVIIGAARATRTGIVWVNAAMLRFNSPACTVTVPDVITNPPTQTMNKAANQKRMNINSLTIAPDPGGDSYGVRRAQGSTRATWRHLYEIHSHSWEPHVTWPHIRRANCARNQIPVASRITAADR
jgi:hypothetical protein